MLSMKQERRGRTNFRYDSPELPKRQEEDS
jgi:hypothetical protein